MPLSMAAPAMAAPPACFPAARLTMPPLPTSIALPDAAGPVPVVGSRRVAAKHKAVVVLGATGTGKSRLAIDLALRFGGEVINSDKIQAYAGLDVATNKVAPAECTGVPHHLLGVVHPDEDFTAADFCRDATRAAAGVAARGRVPIIAGGSNSYVEELVVLRCCCCFFFFFFFCLLATPGAVVVSAAPSPTVCANSGAPVMLGEALRFCGNTGISCCDAVDDDALREELDAMNVPDATCAAIVKSVLCARCIPSLSFVFSSADPTNLSVPLLCASAQAPPVVVTAGAPRTRTSRPAQDQDASSMCLERVSAASFHAMTAHPDGSGRVFLTSRRDGKVWLATMPRRGARAALQISDDGSARRRPFLDLTDDHGGVLRVVGVAFHPEFTTNGRFFVSYISDSRSITPLACGAAGNGYGRSRPCRYHLVVAEFSAQGSAGADFSKATRADPSEVRRIFTLSLPQPQYKLYSYKRHGGQILFRPSIGDSDGYLYLITGYGYSSSSKQNESNNGSFLGKILRFNVGNASAGGSEWPDTDRHHDRTRTDEPEMFAAGLNNPSTCSFDSDRPSHLLCADVNEQRSERVYLITKQPGGTTSSSSRLATVSVIINHGRPADGRMPSIVGGLVYRGSAEPSLNGRYIYVYASGVWSSGRYASTQVMNVRCSWSSPVPCRSRRFGIGSRVLSMAEDNSKDAFFLTTAGVFRVVPSGACGDRPQPQWPTGTGWLLSVGATALALALYVWCAILAVGGQIQIGRCCSCRNFCFINSIFCCPRRYRCPHQS